MLNLTTSMLILGQPCKGTSHLTKEYLRIYNNHRNRDLEKCRYNS